MLVVALGAVLGLAATASATATCAGSGYLVTSTGTIQRFSTSTNAVTATLTVAGAQFADVAVAPDGRTVYAVDTAANAVQVIDTATNTVRASVPGLDAPVAIAVSPDGSRAFVVNGGNNTFGTIDTASLSVIVTHPAGPLPTDAVVSADGTLLYVTTGSNLNAYSTTTGALHTSYDLLTGTSASAVALSATTAYTANGTPFSVSSAPLNGSTTSVLYSGMAGQPTSVAVSPDGTRLYVGTAAVGTGSLLTGPTAGGSLTSIGSADSGTVRSVAVSLDGSTVYGAAFGMVTVTNASGTPVTGLSGAVTSGIAAVAVCPAAVPGAPTAAVADPGDTIASVSWTAPADTGGAPITRYTATASPGGATCTTTGATTCLFTGLRNGTAYTFTVTATNVAGTSAASTASTRVTPRKDNRARVLTLGPATVTYTKKGVGVAFNVTTTGAGVIAAAMTYKGDRYCNVSKRVPAAGTYRVKCVMKAAGRALARKRTTTYTLNASFSPTNGPLASAKPSVVVKRRR
jgi:YVTN family beta-propeller protein